jgi:hypothetical protein
MPLRRSWSRVRRRRALVGDRQEDAIASQLGARGATRFGVHGIHAWTGRPA